jgi:hypothetical protein
MQNSQTKKNLKPLHWVKVTRAMQGSLWAEEAKQYLSLLSIVLLHFVYNFLLHFTNFAKYSHWLAIATHA